MAYSGKFFPMNPEKYRGDVNNIIWRSLWERNVMGKLDLWPECLEWGSEETQIRYRSPVDNKIHRYFPDFRVRLKTQFGIKEAILEVKPKAQCIRPKVPKRKTKAYAESVKRYVVNQAKFEAAKAWCEDQGMEFILLTEDQIFGKRPK